MVNENDMKIHQLMEEDVVSADILGGLVDPNLSSTNASCRGGKGWSTTVEKVKKMNTHFWMTSLFQIFSSFLEKKKKVKVP
jgi:hypothetical protein